MNRFLFFSVLFFAISVILSAQAIYKKGYVVNNTGDTLQGYINDRDWDNNPEKFMFKTSLESLDVKVFDLNNSLYAEITGEESYQRFTVSVSMNEVKLSKIPDWSDTSKVVKTVFLKTLVSGCRINLYSYTDAMKTRYYYLDRSNIIPQELTYIIFNSKKYAQTIMTKKYYIGQLISSSNNYGVLTNELKKHIEQSSYTSNDLEKVVRMINGDNEKNSCPVATTNEKMKLHFFASLHLRRSVIKKIGYSDFGTVSSKSDKTPGYSLSPCIGFDFLRASGSRLFLREDFSFSWDKLSISDKYFESGNYFSQYYSYSIFQWNISLDNLIIYNIYHSSALKIFIGTGIGLNVSKISSKYKERDIDLYSSNTYESNNFIPSPVLWCSFPVKIGCLFKNKFDINATCYLPISVLDRSAYPRRIGTFELGAGWYFH